MEMTYCSPTQVTAVWPAEGSSPRVYMEPQYFTLMEKKRPSDRRRNKHFNMEVRCGLRQIIWIYPRTKQRDPLSV